MNIVVRNTACTVFHVVDMANICVLCGDNELKHNDDSIEVVADGYGHLLHLHANMCIIKLHASTLLMHEHI